MTTIKIKQAGIAPARKPDFPDGHTWSPVNRNLKPHEDIVRIHVGAGCVYGLVTGGFGCNLFGHGHAVFVDAVNNVEHALILREEYRISKGISDLRSLPPDRFRRERWENYDIEEVMVE